MTNAERLGKIGEMLVATYMNGTLSEDKYDSNKDMTINDNQTLEVKTQNRYTEMDAFTVNAPTGKLGIANLIKCFNADHLIFVEYDYSNDIKIWSAPTTNKKYTLFTTSKGCDRIAFPVSQMQLLYTHHDPKLASEMRSLSQSYKFKR